jgi:uncharacterized protein YkwD
MRILFALILLQVSASAADYKSDIAKGVNYSRKSHGLRTLVLNERLNEAAQSQADWMASKGEMNHLREMASDHEEFKFCNYHPANRVINSGYFSFDELFVVEFSDGKVFVDPKPEANENVGEIIAKAFAPGSNDPYNPKVMIKGWMNSPGHRKEILTEEYEEFGVGFSSPRFGETYWCVVFACPIKR